MTLAPVFEKPVAVEAIPSHIKEIMFTKIGERQRPGATWSEDESHYYAEFVNRKATTLICVSYEKTSGKVHCFPLS